MVREWIKKDKFIRELWAESDFGRRVRVRAYHQT